MGSAPLCEQEEERDEDGTRSKAREDLQRHTAKSDVVAIGMVCTCTAGTERETGTFVRTSGNLLLLRATYYRRQQAPAKKQETARLVLVLPRKVRVSTRLSCIYWTPRCRPWDTLQQASVGHECAYVAAFHKFTVAAPRAKKFLGFKSRAQHAFNQMKMKVNVYDMYTQSKKYMATNANRKRLQCKTRYAA